MSCRSVPTEDMNSIRDFFKAPSPVLLTNDSDSHRLRIDWVILNSAFLVEFPCDGWLWTGTYREERVVSFAIWSLPVENWRYSPTRFLFFRRSFLLFKSWACDAEDPLNVTNAVPYGRKHNAMRVIVRVRPICKMLLRIPAIRAQYFEIRGDFEK